MLREMTMIDQPPTDQFPQMVLPPPVGAPEAVEQSRRGWARPPGEPTWYRPSLAGLLGATLVAYLWGLGASGWANAYYSAAAQAGASSWKAWFFGSFDAANAITVDKPPAALWVMGLSARLFGVNSWSILVPEALMGVATVAVVVVAVKRWFRPGAALLAGLVVATTPIAALMFRFNNPDALLVLVLTLGAYCVIRALERPSWRWMAVAGALVGFGFLTKMLQAFLVLPAFALVYLLAAPTDLRRRLSHLVAMGAALVATAGSWVAVVELWPASSRPYIGGSQTNSVLELIFGYNGFGRITGNETGSVTGGPGRNGGAQWGPTGWSRMFNLEYGAQVSWLLPLALVTLAAVVLATFRRPRTDRVRAAILLWGGWLVVTGIVFSLSKGIIHSYYTVALAPAIGALVGIGASLAWQHRQMLTVRLVTAAGVALTTWWAATLLGRTPEWFPWIRPLVIMTGVAGAAVLTIGTRLRWLAGFGASLAAIAAFAGPIAATATTINTPHDGALPTAGPVVAGARSGPGATGPFPGFPGAGQAGSGTPSSAVPGPPPGAPGQPGQPGQRGQGTFGLPTGGGPAGGLLGADEPSDELQALLVIDADSYTWMASTVGANQAAGYQLATDHPVLAIGGFNGSDPSPTLAQFQALVAEGRIHYFIGGGGFGGQNDGARDSSEIAAWVRANYTAQTVTGVTVYDLSAPSG
jgi:4-amino-4-deoxy-L-arabinose transferase-like glycosyltransferase